MLDFFQNLTMICQILMVNPNLTLLNRSLIKQKLELAYISSNALTDELKFSASPEILSSIK